MEINSFAPFLAMAVPLVGVALIYAARNNPNVREGCSLGAASLQFLIVLTMVPAVLAGNTLHFTLFPFLPQVSISLRVDALGILLALAASFLWILTVVYSIGYMRALGEHHQTRFYACFAITLATTMGIAFSANLLTLYVFYEILTFVTYPLVTHEGTREAVAAGRKYLFYHLGASIVFMLPAVFLTYIISGTFDFQSGGVFAAGAGGAVLVIVYFMFLAGAAKAAIDHHPGDPRRAAADFRHAAINQYAGRPMDEPQRKAVATVAAAEPQKVWEAFGAERERFAWREPEQSAPAGQGSATGDYDSAIAFVLGERAQQDRKGG